MGHRMAVGLKRHWKTILTVAAILAAILVLWTPSSRISLASFDEGLGGGVPVVLELYTNY